jgi:hypothetical protein
MNGMVAIQGPWEHWTDRDFLRPSRREWTIAERAASSSDGCMSNSHSLVPEILHRDISFKSVRSYV